MAEGLSILILLAGRVFSREDDVNIHSKRAHYFRDGIDLILLILHQWFLRYVGLRKSPIANYSRVLGKIGGSYVLTMD